MTASYGQFDEYHAAGAGDRDRYPAGIVQYEARAYELETNPKRLSLKYVLDGEMHYESDRRRLCLRAHETALVSSDTIIIGSASSKYQTRGVSIFFPDTIYNTLPEHVEDFSKNLLVKAPALQSTISRYVSAISLWRASECDEADSKAILSELSSIISLYLLELCSLSETASAKKLHTRRDHSSRLLAARAFMDNGSAGSMSIDEIASRFGFTRFQFARLFKRAFGRSPSCYIEMVRMQRAEKMIRTSIEPLHNIADSLGYADYPTFSKSFRRVYSMSPNSLRKPKN